MADETPVMRVAVGTDPNTMIVGPQQPGAQRPTDYKNISLRWDASHNGAASEKEGRAVYDKVLMLTLHYPGSPDKLDVEIKRYPSSGEKPTISDQGRYDMFREIIERFEKNGADAEAGTPVAAINLDPASIKNLEGMGIKTVEQLSDIPDSALGSLKAGGRAMRDRARAYLEEVAGGTGMAKLSAENEGLRGDLSELKRRFDEMAEERRQEKAGIAEGQPPMPKTEDEQASSAPMPKRRS